MGPTDPAVLYPVLDCCLIKFLNHCSAVHSCSQCLQPLSQCGVCWTDLCLCLCVPFPPGLLPALAPCTLDHIDPVYWPYYIISSPLWLLVPLSVLSVVSYWSPFVYLYCYFNGNFDKGEKTQVLSLRSSIQTSLNFLITILQLSIHLPNWLEIQSQLIVHIHHPLHDHMSGWKCLWVTPKSFLVCGIFVLEPLCWGQTGLLLLKLTLSPHGDLAYCGFQSPGAQFPMLSGTNTVKLSNSSCTGELTWTLQNVSVMTILKRKQKKTVRKK